MKKYITLSIKTIRKGKLFHLLALSITLYICLLGIINIISDNMSAAAYAEHCKIFGEFQYIVYMDKNTLGGSRLGDPVIEKEYPNINTDGVGYIYKLGYGMVDNNVVDFGYLDPRARELSHINLLEGEFPAISGELAISDTKRDELGGIYQIGDTVYVNGRPFTLTGFYEDFGSRWIGTENFRFHTEIDGFFSQEDADDIWNKSSTAVLSALITETEALSPDKIQTSKGVFENIYISSSYAKNMYQLSPFIIPAISFIGFMLIGSTYLLIIKSRKKVNHMYQLLGFYGFESSLVQCISFFLCNILGFVMGLILSTVCSRFLMYVLFKKNNGIHILNNSIVIGEVLGLIALLIIINLFSPLLEKLERRRIKRRFVYSNLVCSKGGLIFSGISMMVIISIIQFTHLYQTQYQMNNIPQTIGEMGEIQGKHYDFELRSVDKTNPEIDLSTNMMPDDGKGTYYYSNYMYMGLLDKEVDEFASIDGIKEVKAYKENNTIMLHINGNHVNDYIDACDFIVDGQYQPYIYSNWNDYIKSKVDLENKLIVNSKLVGCMEEDLNKIADYVETGQINIDKIQSGEEVILVIPSFRLNDLGDGYTQMQRLEVNEKVNESYYVDNSFRVGDSIEFYCLQPHNQNLSYGALSTSTVEEQFDLVTCRSKVGAIIYDYLGWFEKDDVARPFTILSHNDAFNSFGLSNTYTRLRIYSDQNISEADVTRNVYKKYKKMETFMNIENKIRGERIHREYLLLLKLISNLLLCLTSIIYLSIIFMHTITQLTVQKKKIGLLRLNGLSVEQLAVSILVKNVITWLGVVIIFHTAYLLYLYNRYSSYGLDLISIQKSIMVALLLLFMQILSYLPCFFLLKRMSIVELLS